MSISDRPIGVFSLFVLLTTLAMWGEYRLFDSNGIYGLNPAAVVVLLLAWLGIVLLSMAVVRAMQGAVRRRRAAERAAEQAGRLMQVTAALGATRTSTAAIEAILQEPMHALHADAGVVLLLSDNRESATAARAVGFDGLPELIPVPPRSMLGDTVERGVVITAMSRRQRRDEYPDASNDLLTKGEALAAVPLLVERRVVAVLVLAFVRAREFQEDDRALLEIVSARGSQALERTRQYESVERARLDAEELRRRADQELAERQRTERALRTSETQHRALAARTARLHELTAALSEAVTIEAVARAVVDHGKIVAGASDAEVLLLAADGSHFEMLSSEDREAQRITAEPGLLLTAAVETRQPVFIGSFAEWQETYWRSAAMAADRGHASSAVLPLLVESKAIGVLAFQFSAPVNFEESYQAVLISVAHHCAQALDRARLYESAEQARTLAETANRHKDEFLSMVSHELRTPLNAILGWASMLEEGILEPAVTARAVRSIHTNATRQSKLVEELLDVSRILSGRTKLDSEPVDISLLLSGVAESVLPLAASNGVELRMELIPSVLVAGDLRRLEQVFLNLLTNALKFTPSGGLITVTGRVDGDTAEVSVTDTGMGIDQDFLPYVFDRFRQADSTTTRAAGGLGLGLSIARHIIEAHKGTITAQSPGTGKGATFTVRIPAEPERRTAPVQPLRDGVRKTDTTVLAGIRVLVVDDESDARDVMAKALEARGAQVTTADSAADGFARVVDGDVDVLLSDIAMPFEDGYSLMRRIRAHADARVSSIPAIAVTAAARREEQDRALAAGFHVHLAKPIEPADLARSVKQVLATPGASRTASHSA